MRQQSVPNVCLTRVLLALHVTCVYLYFRLKGYVVTYVDHHVHRDPLEGSIEIVETTLQLKHSLGFISQQDTLYAAFRYSTTQCPEEQKSSSK